MTAAPVAPAPETPDVVIGNHYHKYGGGNPLIRFLTDRFLAAFDGLLAGVAADPAVGQVLEVGCGEGEIADRLAARFDQVAALDLPDAGLRREWAKRRGVIFVHGDAGRLPYADASFDLVVAVEVLEHLRDPDRGLEELARVTRRHLLLSVPREPLFRMGNLLTGRHVQDLGNTPGHLNHWSTAGFLRFVSARAALVDVRTPFPWTSVHARLDT